MNIQHDSQINMNITSCDIVTGAHITHIYIKQTPDDLGEKPFDSKLLINVPVGLNTSDSTYSPKESQSLYSDISNDSKDTVVKTLNDSTPIRYSDVVKSSQSVLDDSGTYSCHICINDDSLLNSVCDTINTNGSGGVECNDNDLSEDDEYYCRYSSADIDELSDSNLNDRQLSPLRVQSNDSSYEYYSSSDSLVSDSEADGIVTFLNKSNNEVRITLINMLDTEFEYAFKHLNKLF